MGVASKPAGLDAVVSQEPVYDMYRYLYSNRVRFENSLLTPALYTAIDLTPGSIQDDPGYNVNGADNTARPGCYAAELPRTAERRPRLRLLEGPRPDRQGQGLHRAAVHDPGLHREQHEARRRLRLLQRRGRPQAGVVRDVGPRARQRRRRERAPGHGSPRLVRRGHALLRPVPARRGAGGRRSPGRGGDERRLVAVRVPVAAGRRLVDHHGAEARLVHRRRAEQRHRRRRRARGSGPSRRRWRTTRTSRASPR